ncbi:MAG TPA: 30S ribosomal protein S15 [Candidatus Pacearchaeota archaeon]|nr:30S ribosomal protein S15 [Candidatus Parcubacteria bacterium]HOU45654.1 30S ribosomal protein S15 [Candidatus Pacearchaeota archaeon]HPM08284.1 30S ribosomal protein S15 [Candidatus Pacearchaeota archaeon]HQI74583.1 30S ribosomal protein S15 [Candidatus Pacearchaeota archaeon]
MKAKKKGKIIESSQVHDKDTGSADVQIALLSERINAMLSHLKKHAKDLHSKRGLLAMVMKRKKLLAYLKKENEARYESIKKKVGLK